MQILQYLEHTLLKNYCCSSEIPIQLSVLCFRLLNLPTSDTGKERPVYGMPRPETKQKY